MTVTPKAIHLLLGRVERPVVVHREQRRAELLLQALAVRLVHVAREAVLVLAAQRHANAVGLALSVAQPIIPCGNCPASPDVRHGRERGRERQRQTERRVDRRRPRQE